MVVEGGREGGAGLMAVFLPCLFHLPAVMGEKKIKTFGGKVRWDLSRCLLWGEGLGFWKVIDQINPQMRSDGVLTACA